MPFSARTITDAALGVPLAVMIAYFGPPRIRFFEGGSRATTKAIASAPSKVRAIVVNPTTRDIYEVQLPTTPGDPEDGGPGAQIANQIFKDIMGCKRLEYASFGRDTALMVNGEELEDGIVYDFWQWGDSAGCRYHRYLRSSHHDGHVPDVKVSLAEARQKVHFASRRVDGFNVTETAGGVRVDTRRANRAAGSEGSARLARRQNANR